MIGATLNAAGILVGGIAGLKRARPLSAPQEAFFKVALGVFSVYYGLQLTWRSLNGSFLQILKELLVAVIALMIGKLAGQLLQLQKLSNRVGRAARARISAVAANGPQRAEAGFKTCTVLFCAAPLGLLGALQDGLSGYFYPLAVKAVMDGLAAMGFVRIFGWGTVLSAMPVFVLLGTITLVSERFLKQFLEPTLLDPVNAAGGLLVFSAGLVILELKKVDLAGSLPSLLFAPLIAWIWR